MSESLRDRIRAHACDRCDAAAFDERLAALVERIEADFEGAAQERLLALARDAFERHVGMCAESDRIRQGVAALISDQRRLLDLLDFLSRRPQGASVH